MGQKNSKPPLINKYLSKLEETIKKFDRNPNHFYVFRGQSEQGHPIEPISVRKLKSKKKEDKKNVEEGFTKDEFEYLKEHDLTLISDARLKGHCTLNGTRELKDLEVLGDLRHYGSSTSLLDFTSNFLIALWFACGGYDENKPFNPEKQNDKSKHDGDIFILDAGDPSHFLKVNHKAIQNTSGMRHFFDTLYPEDKESNKFEKELSINPILQRRPSWYWIPEHLNDRVRDQDCVFIFGKPRLEKKIYKNITIDNKDKDQLLRELEDYFDYTIESLFCDKHGFAEHYRKDINSPEKQTRYLYNLGMGYLATSDIASADKASADINSAEKYFEQVLDQNSKLISKIEKNIKNIKNIKKKDFLKDHEKLDIDIVIDSYFRLSKIIEVKIKQLKESKDISESKKLNKLISERDNYIKQGREFDERLVEIKAFEKPHRGLEALEYRQK